MELIRFKGENIGNEIQEYVQELRDISEKWDCACFPDDAEGIVDLIVFCGCVNTTEKRQNAHLSIYGASLLFHMAICVIHPDYNQQRNGGGRGAKENRPAFMRLEE